MATGVVFGGYLQDTSIVEAEVPSLAQTSTRTISYLAKECIKEYDLLCAALKETTGASAAASGFSRDDILIKIQDARVRFKAWATNIAALQGGHLKSSLDFRLREATEIRSRLLKILESLRDSLSEAVLIVKGVRGNKIWELGAMSDSSFDSDLGSEYNADGSDDGSVEEKLMTSELDELLSAIKTANSSLMDISIVIRNTPTRDDYIKAAARYSLDSHWDISHVDAKFGSAKNSNEWLIQRLGKSITRRRQYLTYRKEHHDKLSKYWDQPAKEVVVLEEEEIKAPQTLALTKATTYVAGLPAPPKDGSEVESFETETSYQQTVAGETEEHLLKVPPPPKEAFEGIPFEFGQPFQCPYCWTEQNMKGRNAWKKHVFRDLRPYVCTFQQCNLRMFRSRNEWFAHELQAHRREWTCASCSKIFSSRSSFRTHLISHNTSLAGSELDALILQSEEPMDRFPVTACSFCDEWEEQISNPNQNEKRAFLNEGRTIAPYGTKTQFRRHLGRHMEQLALFALPRNSLDDLDDESDREMTGDVGVDDSDASTESTVSERRGLIRAASAGSRNEELQVSKEFHDITKLELCFRCCQCNKISPTSIFKGLDCPSCDHERCARCAHWYGHFRESNGVWHDIREETSADADGAGIKIRGDDGKTDLILQRSDRNADGHNAHAEDLDEQVTIGMPEEGITDENTTTIFIGFYTTQITEDELLFLFHSFGDIIGVRKPNDKPFAYMKFKRRNDAERAVAEMNRFVVRGCSLLVDFAATNYAGGVGNPSANKMPDEDPGHELQDSEDRLLGKQSVPGPCLRDESGRESSVGVDKDGLPSQGVNVVSGSIDTKEVPEYDSIGEELPEIIPYDSHSPVAGPKDLSKTATASVVRVNGLSDAVTEVELRDHFQSCGNITHLKVHFGRGSGEVKFARPAEAKLAVEEKSGSVLCESKIQVELGYLTSSYWSIPDQTGFPIMLEDFGSDWHAIADCMESKTHVMVKNYYERQVQEGHQEWVDIVRKADERLGNTPAPEPLSSPITTSTLGYSPQDPNRMSGTGGASRGSSDNRALLDYETQLRLLEQQNKKRLMMHRQEQDNMIASSQGAQVPNVLSAEDTTSPFGQSTTSRIIGELDPENAKFIPQNEADRNVPHSLGDLRVESSDDDYDNWLETNRRAEKRWKRSSLGSLQKRPTSHGIGGDMEEEDAHPALLEYRDRLSSGTRRIRRKAEDNETNLGYDDKFSEIHEIGEDGGFSEATEGFSGVHKTEVKDGKKIVEAYEEREREFDQQRLQETDRESSEFFLEGQRVLNLAITSPDVGNNIGERQTYAPPTVNASARSAKEAPAVEVEANAEQMNQSVQNEGNHFAEREARERREMDDVASSNGDEPSEEDIERRNLHNLDRDPSDYDSGHSGYYHVSTAKFNTEDPNFDRYIQKRTHELRNFRDPQETSEAPQRLNTTEEDEIAAWHLRIRAQLSKWLKNFTNQVRKARTRYATTQVRTPGFVRNEVAMNKAVEWNAHAEEELQKAEQRLLTAYSTLRNSGSSMGATMDDRIACEKSLIKQGNSIIVDLIIALDSLSGTDSVPEMQEETDSSLVGSKEVETILGKISVLAGHHVAADRNIEGSRMADSADGQSPKYSNSPRKNARDATKEYRVGDNLFIADTGGGTVEFATYKITEPEPLEFEDAASESSDSIPSGIHKEDEDLGQSESSKGKAPARPDDTPSSEPPTRQPTDPSASYKPCDTLLVSNLPPDVSEDELKELFGEQRGYRRMSLRTKASGPTCYVQFEDTVCAMKALFLLQGKPLRNSVNGGIGLGFSRNPLGVRSEPPVAAINSQIEVETLHEEAGDDAKRGREQDTEKQHFERSPAGRALRDFATKESSIRQVWKARQEMRGN